MNARTLTDDQIRERAAIFSQECRNAIAVPSLWKSLELSSTELLAITGAIGETVDDAPEAVQTDAVSPATAIATTQARDTIRGKCRHALSHPLFWLSSGLNRAELEAVESAVVDARATAIEKETDEARDSREAVQRAVETGMN